MLISLVSGTYEKDYDFFSLGALPSVMAAQKNINKGF